MYYGLVICFLVSQLRLIKCQADGTKTVDTTNDPCDSISAIRITYCEVQSDELYGKDWLTRADRTLGCCIIAEIRKCVRDELKDKFCKTQLQTFEKAKIKQEVDTWGQDCSGFKTSKVKCQIALKTNAHDGLLVGIIGSLLLSIFLTCLCCCLSGPRVVRPIERKTIIVQQPRAR